MKILAVEFSSSQRSVALVSGSQPWSVLSEVVETGGRSTRALGMIEAALAQGGVEREAVECLAIGLGPGSYTGIRAAIALAQGWQLASSVKLVGVSSADALAAQAASEGLTGRVAVVIDAQRGEFYLAIYEVTREGWNVREPLRLATREEVQNAANDGCVLAGPEVTNWFPGGRLVFPRAEMLARLALSRANFVSGEELEPIYLRETTFVKAPPPRVIPGLA
jgi:tRNA threonylcarbamoyl adenosine modification protein YeaZ